MRKIGKSGDRWRTAHEESRKRAQTETLSSYDRLVRVLVVLALVALVSGCFGYNKSAKRWAYAGNTVLILGGGGALAASILTKSEPEPLMSTTGQPQEAPYDPPITGGMVAGALLISAGIFGIIFNATRPNVKTSR